MAHVPNTDLSKHVGLDRWTLAVGLLALLVRLAYLTDASADPSFAHPIIDAGEYHRMAITLAQGFDPFNGVYTRPPLYPHLLAGLYRIVGPSASLARMLQALLGGATAMLTVLIGRRLFDRRIGLAGGIIVALYGPLVFFDVRLLASGLVVCTFQLALLLTLRAFQQSTLHAWLLAGLGIGLAALARPNILLFAPLPFVWLVLNKPRQRTGNLLRAGLLTLGVAAMIAPVTLRNYRVSGEIVPIAALGGMNLYLGNNSHAADTLAVRPGAEWDRLARRPHAHGHVSTKQAEAFFIEKVTQFVREQPGRFLAGLARKARLFCHAIEVPRNFDPYLHRDYSIVLQALFWRIGSFAFPFGLLLPLAIWGMVRAGPRRPGAWLAVGFVVCLAFSVILFFTASRYRLPIVPPLAIFAAAGAVHIYRQWTSGQRRRAAGSLSCVLVAAILVNLPITTPYDGVNFQAELYQNVGLDMVGQGDYEQGEKFLLQALQLTPASAVLHTHLAQTVARLNRPGDALRYAEQAVDLAPYLAESHIALAQALASIGSMARAASQAQRALELEPTHDGAYATLAMIRAHQRRFSEAIKFFERALHYSPDKPEYSLQLAKLLVQQHRYSRALEVLRRAKALISHPDIADALAWLLATCPDEQLRDPAKALRLTDYTLRGGQRTNSTYLDTRAAALAAGGQFKEAVETAEQALHHAQVGSDLAQRDAIARRLAVYRMRRDWRDANR